MQVEKEKVREAREVSTKVALVARASTESSLTLAVIRRVPVVTRVRAVMVSAKVMVRRDVTLTILTATALATSPAKTPVIVNLTSLRVIVKATRPVRTTALAISLRASVPGTSHGTTTDLHMVATTELRRVPRTVNLRRLVLMAVTAVNRRRLLTAVTAVSRRLLRTGVMEETVDRSALESVRDRAPHRLRLRRGDSGSVTRERNSSRRRPKAGTAGPRPKRSPLRRLKSQRSVLPKLRARISQLSAPIS